MTDLSPGEPVLIVTGDRDPPLPVVLLYERRWRCDCGGEVWHVQLQDGLHGDFCTSVIRRPN